MIDYLRNYYPEDFNDYIQSSEYIALIDLIAFLGHSIAFRADLNTRENFLDTAERRDSVLRLAKLVSYNPKRNIASTGLLKIDSISTTESVTDPSGNLLTNVPIFWNDSSNTNWFEQFITILNSSMASSQKYGKPANSQLVNDIQTDEYNFQLPTGTNPRLPISTTVDGASTSFEIVSGTTVDKEFIYEDEPQPASSFNVLYRNDKLGNTSNNTGFFFYFKQGTIEELDFTIEEAIPNRIVNFDVTGINNDDVWLYSLDSNGDPDDLWTRVPAVTNSNVIYNTTSDVTRTLYSVNSREDDKIDLVFSDGVFGEIPVGNYRLYARKSIGIAQRITPDEMESLPINISYVSRSGRLETISFNASLKSTVSNSRGAETLDEIRLNAPQEAYTQHRMVTGEDYNILPFTTFSTITKVKAVNRTSSGISRFLDVKDPTGKYSSTNIFADDGLVYKEKSDLTFTFEWITASDITNVIRNQIEPILRGTELNNFYLQEFSRYSLTESTAVSLTWNQQTFTTSQSTGYFTNSTGDVSAIGATVTNNRQYLLENSLVKFEPPSGYHFMEDGSLMAGTTIHTGFKSELWAAIVSVDSDGTTLAGTGVLADNTGATTISTIVPTGAIPTEIIVPWVNDFPIALETSIITNVSLNKDFGLRFDTDTQTWIEITAANLNTGAEFSQGYEGDTSETSLDASWLIMFRTDGSTYTVSYRDLSYFYESALETRFHFEPDLKIYDPKTGKTIKDSIKILKINTAPDSTDSLGVDKTLEIYDAVVEADGYSDDTKVKIKSIDSDDDGIADNPDFFAELVAPMVSPTTKLIFWKKYIDGNNFERWAVQDSGTVNSTYATLAILELNKSSYNDGQVFYATTDEKFYVLSVVGSTRTLTESLEYKQRTGRQDFMFQYKHNSPNSRRIDPSPANIIDLYILTAGYNTSYRNYIQDTTNTVTEPEVPTTTELSNDYNSLEDFKSISDTIVYNSASFKPLFGTKSDTQLQASFKVVKNTKENITDNEVKTRLIAAINEYFAVDNWDFGDTFYASELITYLHNELTPYVSSVVLVPTAPDQVFGSLYQITAQPNEVFVSAATVDDVEIIDSLTEAKLRANGEIVTSVGTQDVITSGALGA